MIYGTDPSYETRAYMTYRALHSNHGWSGYSVPQITNLLLSDTDYCVYGVQGAQMQSFLLLSVQSECH